MHKTLAEKIDTPKGVTKGVAQFNKITGELTAVMANTRAETLNQEFFKYRDIEMDFDTQDVVGTYDDYRIVNRAEEKPIITEESLDLHAQEKITKQYPLAKQISVIAEAINKLSTEIGVETPALAEMIDYIDEVKRSNKVRKEFFRENEDYTYYSREDLAELEARQMEGGVHEAYGDTTPQGGRVFD